ncbi:MAG: glutathione S-transferase family protein [Gammaproteobacteria bacterium]|nr:glutathione S-transferase family protein [Gammaproteobacteria bacterium]
MSIKIYGAMLSPYVRKARLALGFKGLEYETIPVIPLGDDQPEEFKANSPLGKIPLAYIDDIWLPDSSVILAYLERTRPDPALLSDDPKLAARALWFGEYMASKMVPVVGGHLFAELILAPNLFNRESNWEEIELAKNVEIPEIFDYLETQLESDFLVGDDFGHADLCVGGAFLTMRHCEVACDASRWPKTAAYIKRVHALPLFEQTFAEEMAFRSAMVGG